MALGREADIVKEPDSADKFQLYLQGGGVTFHLELLVGH